MRIIVLGAGEVGFDVAQMLSRENHDVVVVDESAGPLDAVRSRLDVLTIQGNGTSADVLKQAGADSADLFIAVTSIDEVNVIGCMVADRLGAQVTVARVRSGEFSRRDSVLSAEELGIDLIIHPEDSTADEIVRLIRRASATDVLNFGDGQLQLVGIRIGETSPVLYRSLEDISATAQNVQFRVMGIQRGVRTIIPGGSERIHKNDQAFVLVRTDDFSALAGVFGVSDTKIQDIMILGGTQVGARVAALLAPEKGMRVKLIEPEREIAEELAEALPGVLVLHGEGSDVDLLAMEGIADVDAFVAVKNDEASNLVTCLIAKHLGVSKTVALLSTAAYLPISQRIGIDSAVNKKRSVTAEVLRFLRGKHVLSLATVPGLDVEILELQAMPGARITRGPIFEIKMPDGVLIGAVVRSNDVAVVTGSTEVRPGDRVIVFALPSMVGDVEKMFQGRKL